MTRRITFGDPPILVLDLDAWVPAPVDSRQDTEVLTVLTLIRQEIKTMSDSVSAEIGMLKTNMTNLHTAVSNIQARFDAALAQLSSQIDPAAVADLASINADLASVVTNLAPPAASGGAAASTTSSGQADAPPPAATPTGSASAA